MYASNTYGPGIFNHTYANNMSDSGYYIGACPDCNSTINHGHAENNDLGYSGSNSGGHLTIKNSEFDNNEEGVATQSQNNDDAPSPQDGDLPGRRRTTRRRRPGAQRTEHLLGDDPQQGDRQQQRRHADGRTARPASSAPA